jgi:hypothetical protein
MWKTQSQKIEKQNTMKVDGSKKTKRVKQESKPSSQCFNTDELIFMVDYSFRH